jgi:hypothetical protein
MGIRLVTRIRHFVVPYCTASTFDDLTTPTQGDFWILKMSFGPLRLRAKSRGYLRPAAHRGFEAADQD